jgi:hypothetical protein
VFHGWASLVYNVMTKYSEDAGGVQGVFGVGTVVVQHWFALLARRFVSTIKAKAVCNSGCEQGKPCLPRLRVGFPGGFGLAAG